MTATSCREIAEQLDRDYVAAEIRALDHSQPGYGQHNLVELANIASSRNYTQLVRF